MHSRLHGSWAAVFLLSISAAFNAHANYNYRGIISGERAMGMGGAYFALSDTTEGGVYNPAGLAFVQQDSLSVAGNLYRLTRGKRKEAVVLAGTSTDLPQDAFTSIPQIAAFAKRFRMPWDEADTKLNTASLAVVVMGQHELTGRVNFDLPTGSASGTRSLFSQTLMIAPSLARRLSDRFSIGFSVNYMLTKSENIGYLSEDSEAVFSQAFVHETTSVGSLFGQVGLRYSPMQDVWVGATYQSPTIRLHSDGTYFRSIGVTDRTDSSLESVSLDLEHLDPRIEMPHRFGLGLAYLKEERWAIAADLLIYLANDYSSVDGIAANIHQKFTVNASLGGEFYLTPKYVLRGGAFTNRSAAPKVQDGVQGQADHVDHYGFTLTASLEEKNSTLTLGGVLTFGSGDGVDNLGNTISVTENSYAIVLAGSYKF